MSLSLRMQTLNMRTQAKAHVRRLSRTNPHTQEERLCTHESKLHTQARVLVHMNQCRELFFNSFKHISTKIHSKHVPTPPEVSIFHQNSSHNKTQAFVSPKTN